MKIHYQMSFEEILGKHESEYSEGERKNRWFEWIKSTQENGEKETAAMWLDSSMCNDCLYLKNHWCTKHKLPSTVNPVLSSRLGIVGTACMGQDYNNTKQYELNFNTTKLQIPIIYIKAENIEGLFSR